MDPQQSIHESDPDQAPDDDFEPGELEHLVPGNTGRMLDPRRTPVAVRSVDRETGVFEVEVLAFEDAGAHWMIEAEGLSHFQFARGAARANADTVAALVAGGWSESRRAEHVVATLAFVRAMFRAAAHERVLLHRGLTAEMPLRPTVPRTFISSTLDRSVAESLATRGPATVGPALSG